MRQSASLTGLLLIAALVAGSAQAGDYYKWTDAQGTVHYSQMRPLDHASTVVRVGDGAPVVPLPAMSNAPSATPEPKAGAQASQTALQKANAQTLSSNCAIAQKNIASLQGHGMVVASGDPKAHALDPDARAQALTDARKEAATYCAHKP